MFKAIGEWWSKTHILDGVFYFCLGVMFLSGTIRTCFWLYDDRVRAYNEASPVLRCEVETDGDEYKIYAVKRSSRYKIASGIKEADLAHKKALLCDPGPSPQVAY